MNNLGEKIKYYINADNNNKGYIIIKKFIYIKMIIKNFL